MLVVDDEADIRLLARLVLTSAGHEVTEAPSGEEALARIQDGESFDAVLLDVRMPGMDGWQVLDRMRDDPDGRDVPVVIFTAQLSASHEAPDPWSQYEHFLLKPFSPDELLATVQRAIEEIRLN